MLFCLLSFGQPISILLMAIFDRKGAPKPDTQFHQSTFISCRPIAAEKGLVRRNPDLVGKRGILERKFGKNKQQKSLKTVVFRQIFGRDDRI